MSSSIIFHQTKKRIKDAFFELASELCPESLSADDWDIMKEGYLSRLSSNTYLTPNDNAIQREMNGILVKFAAHGLHSDRQFLNKSWKLLCSYYTIQDNTDEMTNLEYNYKIPHAMLKLLLHLSNSPTQKKFKSKFYTGQNHLISSTFNSEFNPTKEEISDDEMDLDALDDWKEEFENCDLDWDDLSDGSDDDNSFEDVASEEYDNCKASLRNTTMRRTHRTQTHRNRDLSSNDDRQEEEDFVTDRRCLKYGGSMASYCPLLSTYGLLSDQKKGDVSIRSPSLNPPHSTSILLRLTGINSRLLKSDNTTLLCPERDVLIMVVEMLQGFGNDIFTLITTDTGTATGDYNSHIGPLPMKQFCLSGFAQRICLSGLSSSALTSILMSFVHMGNAALSCYSFIESCAQPTDMIHSDVEQHQSIVVHAATEVFDAIRSTIYGFLQILCEELSDASALILRHDTSCSRTPTLMSLHIQLSRWKEPLRSAAALVSVARVLHQSLSQIKTLTESSGSSNKMVHLISHTSLVTAVIIRELDSIAISCNVLSINLPNSSHFDRTGSYSDLTSSSSSSCNSFSSSHGGNLTNTHLHVRTRDVHPVISTLSFLHQTKNKTETPLSLTISLPIRPDGLLGGFCSQTLQSALQGYFSVFLRSVWLKGDAVASGRHGEAEVGDDDDNDEGAVAALEGGLNLLPPKLSAVVRIVLGSRRDAAVLTLGQSGSWRKSSDTDTNSSSYEPLSSRHVVSAVDRAFTALSVFTLQSPPSSRLTLLPTPYVTKPLRHAPGVNCANASAMQLQKPCGKSTPTKMQQRTFESSLFSNSNLKPKSGVKLSVKKEVVTKKLSGQTSQYGKNYRDMSGRRRSKCFWSESNAVFQSDTKTSFAAYSVVPPAVMLQVMVLKPLRSLVGELQRGSVHCLLHNCGLIRQFEFLHAIMLVGDIDVFASLKELTYKWIDSRRRGATGPGGAVVVPLAMPGVVPELMLQGIGSIRHVVEELTVQIDTRVPALGLLYVAPVASEREAETEQDEERAAATLLTRLGPQHPLSVAGLLRVQVNYRRPLDDIINESALSIYTRCMTLQLRLNVIRWAAERCALIALKTLSDHTTDASAATSRRQCCAGLHSLLHLVCGVQNYLQNRIHGPIWRQFMRSLSSSVSTRDVLLSHRKMLAALDSLLPPVPRALLLRFLRQAMLVLGSFAEALSVDDLLLVDKEANLKLVDPHQLWMRRTEAGLGVLSSRGSEFLRSLRTDFGISMFKGGHSEHSSTDVNSNMEELRAVLGSWD